MPQQSNSTLIQARELAQQGNWVEAERLCEHLLAKPDVECETHNLLGVIHNIQGRFAEAEQMLRQAVAEQPHIAKYHSNLGNALWGLERFEDAEVCYRQALAIDPAFEDARANLAKLMHLVQDLDSAIAEYQFLVRSNPNSTAYHATLALLLESLNRFGEAEEVAEAGLKLDPTSPNLNLVLGICERNSGKLEESLQRFESIDPSKLGAQEGVLFHIERGLLYDRLNRIEPAFTDFMEGNRLEQSHHTGANKARYIERLDSMAHLDVGWLKDRQAIASEPPTPVFLVGFPRSGTTLLDQILDSHPNIQTMEEKPVLARLCQDMDTLSQHHPEGLKDIKRDDLVRLRQLYYQYVADFMELRPGNLLIDKLPLNITKIPYILTVFPDARFILALRHPCDCVLSCFMHWFKPNDAMANFNTLGDTATLYAKVMGLWQKWADNVPLHYHQIYYENLVQDLTAEIKPLMDFLCLDWQEQMTRPHEHAKQRGFINTPSRSQVIQPVYQRASGRWRRYQPYMSEVMGTLQPYIEYFGYD